MNVRLGFALLMGILAAGPASAEGARTATLMTEHIRIDKGERKTFQMEVPAGTVEIDFSYGCNTQSMTNYSLNRVSITLLGPDGTAIRSVSDRFKSESTWGVYDTSYHERKMKFKKPLKPGKFKVRVSVSGGDYENYVNWLEAKAVLAP